MAHGFAALVASQVLVLWSFGLSYQLLFGRAGMLSFGHAVHFGLAAFATTHAVRWLAGAGWPVYELLPLWGGLVGLGCGAILGFPLTRRSGVAFAMATLGLGELLAACFLMFPGFFGGEAGVTLHRTSVPSLLGVDYGRPAAQLALTAAWVGLVLAAVRWLQGTPFGLASLAVRENPERIQFLGFRTTTVRWVAFTLAGALAGIAGALSALTFEIVTVDAVSLHTSANVLLVTVIGGASSLAGPLVGACFLTLMQTVVSEWTRAWLFYYGLVFVVLVLVAPDGVVGLLADARRQRPRAGALALAGWLVFAVTCVVFVETAYQVALGEPTRLPGWASLAPGALRGVLLASGAAAAAAVGAWLRRREALR